MPPPRLTVLAARDADVAVVLRRGPTDWVRLYRWDTSNDEVEPGGWLHARVDGRRTDLSPDGRLFVAFVAGHGRTDERRRDTWVAISRPPWWRALALWFDGSTWSYGGFFPSACSCAGTGPGPPDEGTVPPWFDADASLPTPLAEPEWTTATVPHHRRQRDGWSEVENDWWERPLATRGMAVLTRRRDVRTERQLDAAVRTSDGSLVPFSAGTSLDVDRTGRALVGRAGRLEVHTGDGEVAVVADLGRDRPEPLAPPAWTARWPQPPRRRVRVV